jgi:glycosyltransferase involved in cell wall biosynthesis
MNKPPSPMRVLLISHTCQSRREGQPKAAQLSRLPGVELRVLVPDRWHEYGNWRRAQPPLEGEYEYQVGAVRWPWSGPAQWYLHWYPDLARTLREFQPDIVDLWEEPWGLVSAHAAWLCRRLLPQAKIIAETEQNIAKTLPPPFETFRSYTLRRADFVIGRSREAVENTRAKGYAGPAAAVPNAVDADLFRPLDRAECRRALGLSGFVAGYIGRIVEEKGLAEMVDALALCPPDVTLLFLGSGAYQPVLEQRVREAGLADRVRFLAARPLEELPQVMNALDTLVLPSRTTPRWKEQFGRVIIEAHACETPVVGSDSGAIPDVIGKAGLVFPEGDPQALAAALSALRADPRLAREMGRIGRRQVEECYTWTRVAERMRDIYRGVLDAGSAERSRQDGLGWSSGSS